MTSSSSFLEVYKGRRVLVTGHTGFKGSWLCAWLKQLGATVIGVSLPPSENYPSLFDEAHISEGMSSFFQDINDYEGLKKIFAETQPEIIFHMAAQALVRLSYREPLNTYMTNVIGTANVLEAARHCSSVKTIVAITSDKCYYNNEWFWGYRETDTLGGVEPYSASKACAELVIASYREGLLPLQERKIHLASTRAGNVIGGGNWSEDRLVPDLIQALHQKKTIKLRNPKATRPWQHVLEPLRGYLMLGAALDSSDGEKYASAWNFGPTGENSISVESLVHQLAEFWGESVNVEITSDPIPECNLLRLDASKAEALLGWKPALNIRESLALTVEWYKNYYKKPGQAEELLNAQIEGYRW